MLPREAKTWALPASIVLVLAAWGWSLWSHVFKPGANAMPPSVRAIAAFVALKAVVVLAAVWLLLRANGEALEALGFSGPAFRRAVVRSLAAAVGLFVLVNVAVPPVLAALGFGKGGDRLAALFRDPREAPYWVFAAVVGGGFAEELWRAFVLTRFERALGKAGLFAALAADTVVFGLGHLYQGSAGAVQAAVSGLAFALVFLARRRVADAMAAHAAYDLFGIAAAYALYAPRV